MPAPAVACGLPAVASAEAGVAIGPAGAGFCLARLATVNSIARPIGMRAAPLFLSIQP